MRHVIVLVLLVSLSALCSCGGGLTGNTDLDSMTVPSGYVEGYIYAPSGAGRAAQDTAQNYVPLPEAEITVTCESVRRSTYTDTSGYYKIGWLPVGSCDLVASKAGYDDLEKQVEISEGDTSQISYSIDDKMLGRVLTEDGTDYSGSTVTISQGDFDEAVEADERGIYVFPDPGNFDDGTVTIQATNSCEYYLPASATVEIANSEILSSSVPALTLQLFLSPPTIIEVSQKGGAYIKWESPYYTNEIGYRIYRSTVPAGPYEEILRGATSKCTYACIYVDVFFSYEPGTTYYYKIKTYSIDGKVESSFTEVQNVTYLTESVDLQLTIDMDGHEFTVGDPLETKIRLSNTGTETIYTYALDFAVGALFLKLINPDGEIWYAEYALPDYEIFPVNIEPGTHSEISTNLSWEDGNLYEDFFWTEYPYYYTRPYGKEWEEHYALTQPGKYRVQAAYNGSSNFPDSWEGSVVSNEIEFTLF
ncbi:MAG TPA: carboxypeptidase regulatory-like domain-containing protein [bacterium]|nr:carboxypeptidase regulatory-like domain-containing protein [bacterium]